MWFYAFYAIILIYVILSGIGFVMLYFRSQKKVEQEEGADATMSIDPLPVMPDSWKAPADITMVMRPSYRPPAPVFILPSILDEDEDQDKIITNPYGITIK